MELDIGGRAEAGVDSTKATRLIFASTPEDLDSGEEYEPEFTHQVFEDERIHGFKTVSIKIYFAAGSMTQYYTVRKGGVSRDSDMDPTDIDAELEEILEEPVKTKAKFVAQLAADQREFRPVGEKVAEYRLEAPKPSGPKAPKLADDNVVYEIYRADPNDPAVLPFHRRLETTAFFYIDAASRLEDDHRSEAFYIFARRTEGDVTTYTTVGYSTVALFFHYPDKERRRIAQFLVLPPYQQKGHGSRLYEAIVKDALSRDNVSDLTVESPAKQFQYMRDRCDLRRLLDREDLEPLIKLPLTSKDIAEFARLTKLSKRQASRILEILLLKRQRLDEASKKAYRLHVKARLARENEMDMAVLEKRREQQQALAEMFAQVRDEYKKVLESL